MNFDEKLQLALDQMDTDLLDHCMSVRRITVAVCKQMGVDYDILEKAALLHDIGKVLIPQSILQKAGPLTQIERDVIDLHSYIGYRIAKEMDIDDLVCQVILLHHGRDKPCIHNKPDVTERAVYLAEILHTVDAYEALTSDRPYRERYSEKEAVEILEAEEDNRPEVVSAIKTILP